MGLTHGFPTQPGRRILPDLTAIADRNDRLCFEGLDAREKATLELLLRKLTASNEIRDVPVE
jgi:DNA-binding MarR family transcriptional regulator